MDLDKLKQLVVEANNSNASEEERKVAALKACELALPLVEKLDKLPSWAKSMLTK
jgi:hypothetical protein